MNWIGCNQDTMYYYMLLNKLLGCNGYKKCAVKLNEWKISFKRSWVIREAN